MRKRISFLLCFFINTQSFALDEKNFEIMMESSYKSTHNVKIPKLVENRIEVDFIKKDFWENIDNETDRRGRILQNRQTLEVFLFLNDKKYHLFKQNEFLPYGQKVTAFTCKESKSRKILFILTEYGTWSNIYPWYIQYRPYVYEIINNQLFERNKNIENEYFSTLSPTITTDNVSKKRVVYPYYNREKILERLYKTNLCVRPLPKILDIEKTLKKKDLKTYNKEFFQNLLLEKLIEKKTLTSYNNIAYYLQKAGSNEEAVYLLEKILEKYPNRTVAHYNLADAYWALGEKKKAVASYNTYIEQMCNAGKEKRIPQVVIDRASSK